MKNKLIRDKNIRTAISENSNNSLLLKVLFNNRILPLKLRTQYAIQARSNRKFPAKNKRGHNVYESHIRNYCQFTGRSRGVLSLWKVSRIVFKRNADFGLIPGIKGASW